MLGLCDGEAVAGNDDDLLGIAAAIGRTCRIDRMDLALRCAAADAAVVPLSVPNPPSITLTNERFMPWHMM